jgi:hypothetical protein
VYSSRIKRDHHALAAAQRGPADQGELLVYVETAAEIDAYKDKNILERPRPQSGFTGWTLREKASNAISLPMEPAAWTSTCRARHRERRSWG